MKTEKADTKELFQQLDDATSEFFRIVSSFEELQLNQRPYTNGWSAGQVAEHVMLSNRNIVQELSKPGKVCERQPDAGVERIRSVFLNFDKKMNAPDFIVPTRDVYKKEALVRSLKKSIDELNDVAKREEVFEIVNHAIFGEVTRLENLFFVLYHTQRHIHQLRKIQAIIQTGRN